MGSVRKLTKIVPAIALAAGLTTPFTAQAADLLMEPAVIEAPEVQSTGGWYLRGDITYDLRSTDGGTYYPARQMFTDVSADNAFDLGIGIGYQVNDYFRVDATADYLFKSSWTGTSVDTNYVCPGLQAAGGGSVTEGWEPGTCDSTDTFNSTTIKLLANAYWDIGNYNGFTPYVGAGIGGAYVKYGDITADIRSATQACCVPFTGTATYKGTDSWRFAYALHAGFSYDLSHAWKLDLGYTYSDIAGGEIVNFGSSGVPQAYDKGFQDHVFRAGVRYQIW